MRAAFFYGWYPEHWAEGHVWTPLKGVYNSSDWNVIIPQVWELITTYNEWVEGSGVEDSDAGVYGSSQ